MLYYDMVRRKSYNHILHLRTRAINFDVIYKYRKYCYGYNTYIIQAYNSDFLIILKIKLNKV